MLVMHAVESLFKSMNSTDFLCENSLRSYILLGNVYPCPDYLLTPLLELSGCGKELSFDRIQAQCYADTIASELTMRPHVCGQGPKKKVITATNNFDLSESQHHIN